MRTPRSRKVKVIVTPEIIDASVVRDSQHCMIAEAIKASWPDAKNISVDLASIRFTDPRKGFRYTYLTPRVAQVQLVRFDQGDKPEPFEFQLRAGHVTRSGSNSKKPATDKKVSAAESARRIEVGKKLQESLKKARMAPHHTDGRIPDRVGGKSAPMQKLKDGVPFTRRRAFGLRALEF